MVQAKSCLATFSVGLGLILVILGVVVKYSLFPTLLESQIYDNLDLRDGTEAFDAFVSKKNENYNFFDAHKKGYEKEQKQKLSK